MSDLDEPLALTGDDGAATLQVQGAQVLTWEPSGHGPVLFLSREAVHERGRAIRGGIPVCLPWFGPGRSGDRTPAHGFARLLPWRVVRADGPEAVLRLTDADVPPEHRASFPHAFRAELAVTCGAQLQLRLSVTNTGEEPVEIEEALHAYLTVGDVREVEIRGLEDVPHLDKLQDGRRVPAAGEPLRITGETDRVYLSGGPVVVEDPVLGRRLTVTTEGAADTVVWNPSTDKAARMSDFGDDEWAVMLCVEGANVLEDAVTIAPGATHTMGWRLGVDPL